LEKNIIFAADFIVNNKKDYIIFGFFKT